MKIIITLCICFTLPWFNWAGDSKKDDLLAQVLEGNAQYRGKAILDELKVVWTQINERAYLVRKKPHFVMILILNEKGDIAYAEGFDGQLSWERIGDGAPYETKGRPRVALWHTTQIPSPLMALYQMESFGHELQYLGKASVEKQPFHRVLLTLSDGWKTEYFVHAKTFQILRSRNTRRFHAVDKKIRRIETLWSDFRDVEGLKVAFAIRELDMDTGETLTEGTSLKIRLNVEIPDKVFAIDGDHQSIIHFGN